MKEKKQRDTKGTSLLLLALALGVGLLVGFRVIQPLVVEKTSRIENPMGQQRQLLVGDKQLAVEVRDTEAGRELGLSGRESLPEGQGMLFIFENKQQPLFWMKDMMIALDMVWILDGKVVQIDENVPPPTKEIPRVATRVPTGLVDWVLEVPSGWVAKYGVKVGDEVVLEN